MSGALRSTFRYRRCVAGALLVVSAIGCTTSDQPYRGQELRSIKALSASEVHQYLAGAGMGTARAAELNRYPGPMHVEEHADALALSPAQRAATRAVFERMHARAKSFGKEIVDQEAALDRDYAGGAAVEEDVRRMVREIARLQGEFRLAHLEAHLSMRTILTAAQIEQYSALRGYSR